MLGQFPRQINEYESQMKWVWHHSKFAVQEASFFLQTPSGTTSTIHLYPVEQSVWGTCVPCPYIAFNSLEAIMSTCVCAYITNLSMHFHQERLTIDRPGYIFPWQNGTGRFLIHTWRYQQRFAFRRVTTSPYVRKADYKMKTCTNKDYTSKPIPTDNAGTCYWLSTGTLWVIRF